MEQTKVTGAPDNTAIRTALWRALHVQLDDQPAVIEDEVGFALIKPEENWQERPDMKFTARLRASIVARARFIEDLVKEQIQLGTNQYVLLGAGLDSFAQRNAQISAQVDIYEIDQANTLIWKEQKLKENGYDIPGNLHFVPVDFENMSWWNQLSVSGFESGKKTVVSCTGVTLYLTKEAIVDTLGKLTLLAKGSVIAISFYLPLALIEKEDQPLMEMSIKGAAASGTPFESFFPPQEVVTLARGLGFKNIRTISTGDMAEMYFKNRADGLSPASGEYFLVADV